jgi:hypothetical protein
MQPKGVFQRWQCERTVVEAQMDALLIAGLPTSREERKVRQTQFQALIERREAAARNLLEFDRSLRHRK